MHIYKQHIYISEFYAPKFRDSTLFSNTMDIKYVILDHAENWEIPKGRNWLNEFQRWNIVNK